MFLSKKLTSVVMIGDNDKHEISTTLLELTKYEDGTAERLVKSLLELFRVDEIDLERLIGFCSDTCSVMFGINKSVSTILKKEIPQIMSIKCSCHSIHLCTSY